MLRKVLAVIAGFVAASIIMMVFEFTNSKIFQIPADLDYNNLEALREYTSKLPQTVWVMVLAGWFLGSFASGFVVRKIVATSGIGLPLIVSVLLALGGVMNFMFLPHPVWVIVLGMLIFFTMPTLGHKFGGK